MPFDEKNKKNIPISYELTAKKDDSAISQEDLLERKRMVQKLKEKIRAGTYKPTIGEIAVHLVRCNLNAECF
ncbi:Anti-sigma-28 factor, FlgM [Maridesulfovibrio ferrireducens]|uniref:Anti-sigma-28 factor, FlgM n=1 Tax=Maridesulfovibrio ferrireducens TaxID=246191 RepID=A0A1G9C0L4_9BACT|nr:flagellar biosynthesis anti-sigma factor FlgM [Maridesulfovibrio ferrireducens]SDK45153.1 Anti-sigma-28 factor, FlgM [Maridesulfovibrio ferrireducens]